MPKKNVIKEGKKIYGTQITLAILTESFSEFNKSRYTKDKTFFPYQIFNCINYFDIFKDSVSQVRIISATLITFGFFLRFFFLDLCFCFCCYFYLFCFGELKVKVKVALLLLLLLSHFSRVSVQPHRRQPTGLPCPWDSPGKNTGVGCHFLLQCVKVKSESEVAQSCPTLCDPMDCTIHGILQARNWSG